MKKNDLTQNFQDDEHWIYGVFYYNKNDRRLFPPKRIKYLGFTVNFANPYSIFAFLLIFAAILVIYYFLQKTYHFN